MHQHFCDALSAQFLYETLQTGSNTPDILLQEEVDIYVESFLADLLISEAKEANTWKTIWDACPKKEDKTSNLIRKMLKIHKISFGNNLSEIDFSGLDLKEVPLIGFCFDEKSRGHFRGTVLGHDTLWETGHRMMISS